MSANQSVPKVNALFFSSECHRYFSHSMDLILFQKRVFFFSWINHWITVNVCAINFVLFSTGANPTSSSKYSIVTALGKIIHPWLCIATNCQCGIGRRSYRSMRQIWPAIQDGRVSRWLLMICRLELKWPPLRWLIKMTAMKMATFQGDHIGWLKDGLH